MLRITSCALLPLLVAALMAGCATVPEGRPLNLTEAKAPAWSYRSGNDEMVVSVSPAGKSLRLAGSAGLVVGSTVDAAVNAKYRGKIRELLGDYDTAAVIEERLAARLGKAVKTDLDEVSPMSSTAGFDSKRQAEEARYENLAKTGHDVLLEVRASHGIFSHLGILVVKLEGKLVLLPEGTKLWDNVVFVDTLPILADDALGDPTDRLTPKIKGARLTVQKGLMERWEEQGSEKMKAGFEETVDAAVSALLCDVGVVEEPEGEYHLGKLAMDRKNFDEALERFQKAVQLKQDFPEAHNGIAVCLALSEEYDDAIEWATKLTEKWPTYAPAWYNLAWWHAVDKEEPSLARPYYEKALELGMQPSERIEERLEK